MPAPAPGPGEDRDETTASRSQSEALAEVERAIAALEAQRDLLGAEVVETALGPLRERRTALRGAAAGERRRLVTVLFADLEGFTVLSRLLDAEDTRDVVNRCFSRWQRVIAEHGGTVEKYIGDAAMAVFGLQVSGEDDAVRAVRAGRAMVASLAEVADETEARHGVRLHMRVGVDTGDVVVSTLGERGDDFVAVGPTVNRASRLQGEAPRDGVLISEDTRRQVRGRFGLEPRPGLVLKGIDEPVDAHVVLAERPPGFDLDTGAGVGGVETDTVGRDAELARLQEDLAAVVEESRWRVTTVVGDAGVGKSRLLAELDAWLGERSERVWWFRGRASAGSTDRPHALLRDVVATRFGISPTDSPASVAEKCEAGYTLAFGPGPDARRESRMVARWLGFAVEDDPDLTLPRDPQLLRSEASAVLAGYLARLAEKQPVVVILEDLHWADDASLTWLEGADDVLGDAPVWIVASARPTFAERRPHWGEGLDHHARLRLEPLSRRHARTLLAQLLQRVDDVPAALTDLVVETAEGNPYYVEELVTWLVDAGVVVAGDDRWRVVPERIGRARVPATLTALLQSRLDGLRGRERSVLQRAAVVGRVFWDDAVLRLGDGVEHSPVPDVLEGLRGRDLVQRRARSAFDGSGEFLFKHALLRDATYEGMLRSHRRVFHARAAEWLIAVTAAHGRTDEFAALVAEHAERAGDPSAAGWYLRAGRRAASVYANEEALRLLGRGLDLTPADHDLAFDLLAAHQEVNHLLADREAQADDLEGMAALLEVVSPSRLVVHHMARTQLAFETSDYGQAVTWARRAVAQADHVGTPEQRAETRLLAGKALTWSGDAAGARDALVDAIDRARSHELPALEGEGLRYLGMLAGDASDFAASLDLLARAQAVFAADSDSQGVGRTLVQRGTTLYNQGRLPEARAALEESRPAFARSGDRYAEAVVTGNLATIAASQGELGAALDWLDDAIAAMRRMGDVDATGVNLTARSDVLHQLGRDDEALVASDEAVVATASVGNQTLLSYAHQTRARALASLGRSAEAVGAAREAVAAARVSASERERGGSEVCLGECLRATGSPADLDEAAARLERGRELLTGLGVEAGAAAATAALAGTALERGEEDRARDLAASLVEPLSGEMALEGIEPEQALLSCLRVLRALDHPAAARVRERARAVVAQRADRVGEQHRASYLATPVVTALLDA